MIPINNVFLIVELAEIYMHKARTSLILMWFSFSFILTYVNYVIHIIGQINVKHEIRTFVYLEYNSYLKTHLIPFLSIKTG